MKDRLERWLHRQKINLWDRGDAFGILIVCVMLLAPAFAFRAAQWPLEMRTIVPVIIFSVLFSYFLARSRYDELFTLLLIVVYGFVSILTIAGINEPTDPVTGVYNVIFRTIQWVYDGFTGGINQDDTVFTLLVGLGFWFMGYNATWHVFRVDRPWRAILLPGAALVVNMAIYTGRNSLDLYLGIFVLMALLVLVRSAMNTREENWMYSGIRVPRQVRPQLMRVGTVIAVGCLLAAWAVPRSDVQQRLESFQEFLRSNPFQEFSDLFNRLFAPIEAEGPATADYYGTELLSLTGAIRLGDQPVLFVSAPNDRRWYWRSRVFERYDTGQWTPSSTWRVTDATAPIDLILSQEYVGDRRIAVTQTFTIGSGGSRLIYAAPQPQSIDLSGRVDLVRLNESAGDSSPVNISVARPLRVLEQGTRYNVTSLISVATADELRSAGTDYPQWVINPNTYVGMSLSPRVVQLAQSIVANAGATTPYDQAKAIETWLRTNIGYNERIPAPPLDRDPVEWFLFDVKEGYCTYFATAMATMLRSLDIPARMAAGFSQGTYDAALGQYVVRERDAHTWVEVYFPGYGWIEFEPTSSEDPVIRTGDPQTAPPPNEEVSAPTPQPSATPTVTLTPTEPPTPTPTPTLERNLQQNPDPPTPTPTPSPTPTPTPVIVPTVAPPVQPPQPPANDLLQSLLRALGVGLLLFLLALAAVLIATFLWWWWEWRGMGGLSPVARAYKRLERYVPLAGVKVSDVQTPEEKRRRIVQSLPQAERPITYITRSYTRERYAPPTIRDADGPEITNSDRAWLDARRTILQRWLARLLPWRR
jgi:transglutaminase-like putative cysteine protease